MILEISIVLGVFVGFQVLVKKIWSDDYQEDKVITYMMSNIFIGLPLTILTFWILFTSIKVGCSAILDVGGCDKSGYCGVRLEDGAFTAAMLPVVGQQVCTFKTVPRF